MWGRKNLGQLGAKKGGSGGRLQSKGVPHGFRALCIQGLARIMYVYGFIAECVRNP